jgi:saposin
MLFALLCLASSFVGERRPPRRLSLRGIGDSSQQCIMCKFMVSMVEDQIKDGATEEQIVKVLEGICDYMATSVQPICRQIVETGVPEIIDLVLKKFNPHEVCKIMTLCKD